MRELLAAACLLLGAWCALGGIVALVRGARSRAWPVTQGIVRAARVIEKLNSEADPVRRQELEYSYVVDGKKYRGSRIRFGLPAFVMWSAQLTRTFRVGEEVPVFHSPASPAVSTLQAGVSAFALVPIAAGATILWAGVQLL
ncbi:MAG TPA: DUF3592 domain-containing protein [Thermoanaerobaculia bacterium]|nr:DUF3592 domain-containing protein [Thermoanaerobaculia bacterium]